MRSLRSDFAFEDSGRGVLREKEESRSDDGTREGHYSEAKPNGRSRKTTKSEAYSSAQRRPFAEQNIFTRSVKDILLRRTELPDRRGQKSPSNGAQHAYRGGVPGLRGGKIIVPPELT